MKQLSDCCKAEIILTGKDRPNAFSCSKCGRIIGTPINKSQTEGKKDKTLYRYEISYKSYDDETDVVLKEYPVLRETDFCYFINPQIIGIPKEAKKRVLKLEKFNNGYQQTGEHTKRFAYVNKNDARLNFIKRTQRRIAWYDFWKEECQKGLEIIKSL